MKEITDHEEFRNNVVDSNNPVVVDFYAEWCGPCKMYSNIFEETSNEYQDKDVSFVKVNIDNMLDLAQTYNIRGVPTTCVFDRGEVATARSGVIQKPNLKALIEQYI